MLGAVVKGLVVLFFLVSGIQAGKRFQDVMQFGKKSGSKCQNCQLAGWSPDTNLWDEKLYPAWRSGDARWEHCWRGGKVVALLTSDSPALIGSNVTFAVTLRFPRCQKENQDGDIVYESGCGNVSSSFSEQYVYNWTNLLDLCGGNCDIVNRFPDGRPFPYHRHWRRHHFIYIFSTQGQYYQTTGRSSAVLSINTTNITAGTQMIEVTVFRRDYQKYQPVAKASSIYVVTDKIPFYVKLSQRNDKKHSDEIFIKDEPIKFDVKIHDPSHYLKDAKLTFDWDYGDGSGSFVSNNPVSSHTYTLLGNFSVNLTIKAAIPAPCKPIPPTPLPTTHLPTTTSTFTTTTTATTTAATTTTATTTNPFFTTTNSTENSTELPFEAGTFPLTTEMPDITTPYITTGHTTTPSTTPASSCFIYRYGYYRTKITVVDGILKVKIIEMTTIQVSKSGTGNSLIDFKVTCQGGLPTDACIEVSNSNCTVLQNTVCVAVQTSGPCLLTLQSAFEPGTYCVNITLSDSTSLALASTMVSVAGGSNPQQTVAAVLIPLALVAIIAVVVGVLLYKKYKVYRPIANASDEGSGQGFTVYFSQIKDAFLRRNNEHAPLLGN